MREKAIVCALLLIAVLFVGNAGAVSGGTGIILPLQEVDQPADIANLGWCWAACTKSVLNYYGITANADQCNIVTQRGRVTVGDWIWTNLYNHDLFTYCCLSSSLSDDYCRQGNSLHGYSAQGYKKGSVKQILQQIYGVTSDDYAYATLSPSVIRTHLMSGRPVMAAWTTPPPDPAQPNVFGGHAILIRGIVGGEYNDPTTTTLYYMDPSPNWNNYRASTYNWFVGGTEYARWWSQSLLITSYHTVAPSPYLQIRVNGSIADSYTVSPGQLLNITADLTPNGNTDYADWWAGRSYGGIDWYRNIAGAWSQTPVPMYQGRLTPVSNTQIFYGSLESGIHTISFAVDLSIDGALNGMFFFAQVNIYVQ